MIKSIIKITICCLFVFSKPVFAQKIRNKNFVFVSNDYTQVGSGKVFIKFFSDEIKYEQGYNMYRKKDGTTDFIKINKSPIIFLKSLPPQLKLAGEFSEFYKNLSTTSTETINKTGMGKAIVKLKAVLNFDFAYAIGNAYIDSTAIRGETYQYQVKKIKNGLESMVATSLNLKIENWKKVSEPQDIKFEKKREGVKFTWLHQPELFLGLDIYRKADKDKTFKKLNDTPVFPQLQDNGKYPKYYFSDPTASNDTIYQYKFNSVDYFGQVSLSTPEIKVGKKDFEPPFPPDSVQLDVDTLSIKLKWKAPISPDLMGYYIYRSKKYDKEYEKVTTKVIPKITPKYTDIIPKVDEYFYQVASVDSSGNEGFSVPIMADVRDVVAPQTPKNLKAVIENGMIVLTWLPSPDPDLKGYFVYKAPAGGEDFMILNGKPFLEPKFSIKYSKSSKTKYVYKVSAMDSSFNRSKPSETVSLQLPDVMSPTQPFIKSVEVKDDYPSIIWMKNVDNDLKNYILVRMKYAKDTTKTILKNNISINDSIFIDKSAETNETYKYILYAIDSTGNSSLGSTPYMFKNVNLNTLLKVKKIEAKYDKKLKNVQISWILDVDKNYYGCVLFRSFENEDISQYTGKMTSDVLIIDKNIKKPGKYTYQLRIYDKLGNVIKSDEKSVEVPKQE